MTWQRKTREKAVLNIPEGFEEIREGKLQTGDMTWNTGEETFKSIEKDRTGQEIEEFYFVIRRKSI